jgi:glycosyltransferase involved in cell wall biosynthesis
MSLISVIVTTYNWKEALERCLEGLFCQDDLNFEIIIADDGSRPDTAELIAMYSQISPVPIKHIYHEDKGFRAAKIRNKAVLNCSGDYLIFLDGDCIALPHFIARHRKLAKNAHFVPGNRILFNQSFTQTIIDQRQLIHKTPLLTFVMWRLQKKINRLLPLIYLPFNQFRLLRLNYWGGAMTCNLAVWKEDFYAVNGFDECFYGWGYEDSDLIVRLIHHGVKRKEGRFALPVFHLWHKQNDRYQQENNYQLLMQRVNDSFFIRAEKGIYESR